MCMCSSPYKKRADPCLYESEKKDVIISKLKSEAFELQQSEQDYEYINTRLINLNHRCNLLEKEIALDEKEYSQRDELNANTIRLLKEELLALRSKFNLIEEDILIIREENTKSNRGVSIRSNDQATLKCELADVFDENKSLSLEIADLKVQISQLQAQVKEENLYYQQVLGDVGEADLRKAKNEKLIKELEKEVEILFKENDQLKEQQSNLRVSVANRNNSVQDTEVRLIRNRKTIAELECRISECRKVNERLTTQISITEQEQRQENSKGAEQASRVKALEGLNQEKEDEILELRRQLRELRNQKAELLEETDALNNDIEVCHEHLDLLTQENCDLLDEIERMNIEDAGVRRVLHREDRVQEAKEKYEKKMRSSQTTMNTSLQSPAKVNSATSKGSH